MASKKAATVAELEILNLATQAAFDKFQEGSWGDDESLREYILNGKHPGLRYKNQILFELNDGLFAIRKGSVIRITEDVGSLSEPKDVESLNDEQVVGSVVSWNTPKTGLTLLLNGDENVNDLVNLGYNDKFPTISFICAGRFYRKSEKDADETLAAAFAELVGSGDIEVVDFTMDTSKDLTADEKRKLTAWYENKSKNKPPVGEPGFSIVGCDSANSTQYARWHRAGTVLLHDSRASVNKSYLLGVDENQYFGVELPTNPVSINDAYTDLMPPAARNIPNALRQGEWFAVPIDESAVPKKTDYAFVIENDDTETANGLALPVDDPDSNLHYIAAEEGGISKHGTVYVKNFRLVHSSEDHADLVGAEDQWYTFHRNTAIRSFSVQGVD